MWEQRKLRSKGAKDKQTQATGQVAGKQAVVAVNIEESGRASPAQKALYRRFWSKIIGQVKDGLRSEH
jgi:hypothetical protein